MYSEEFPPLVVSTVDRPRCAPDGLGQGAERGWSIPEVADTVPWRARGIVAPASGSHPGRYGLPPGRPPPSSGHCRRTGWGQIGPVGHPGAVAGNSRLFPNI